MLSDINTDWMNIRAKRRHMQTVQQASHIIGGRSSSSSQKGFFRGSSFTLLFLSSTFTSTFSSTFCFSSSASTLRVWVTAGLGGGVSDGGERGSVTAVTEVLGMSPSCFPSSSCLSLSPALWGRVGALEGGAWGSARTVTMLLKSSDKTEITRNYSVNQDCITHSRKKKASALLSVLGNFVEHSPVVDVTIVSKIYFLTFSPLLTAEVVRCQHVSILI